MNKGFVDEVRKIDEPELPFELDFGEFETGKFYEFAKNIKIPIYGSPTIEELTFGKKLNEAKLDQLHLMLDFSIFLIRSRTGINLTKSQISKVPVAKLKELMDFFTAETKGINQGDEEKKENPPIGLLSIGDSVVDTQATEDLTPTDSGVAL